MAYEMLVGRLPFPDTESAMALLMKHVNDPVPPPRSVNRDLDEDLATWIEQLLEKSPEQRIRSAADAWDELEETVIRIFGARWRREARLPEPAAAADTPRPLTPAPFSEAIPGDAPAESQPGEAGDAFQSFVWLDPAKPPPAAPPEPSIAAAPEPEPEGVPEPTTAQAGASGPGVTESDVAESTEAEAEPAEADGPQPAVAGSEADEPARPETHERTPGFVTYGRRPTEAPVEPVAEPPPPVPEEASVVDQPEEWPATVAPKAIPAPAPSVEPVRERPQPGPSRPAMRTGPLVVLGVALVIGAGVGWLVAPTSKRSAAPAPALASTASNAALELRFPDGWRPTRRRPAGQRTGAHGPGGARRISTRRRRHRRHQQGRRPDAAPVGAPRSPAHRSPAGDRREARSGRGVPLRGAHDERAGAAPHAATRSRRRRARSRSRASTRRPGRPTARRSPRRCGCATPARTRSAPTPGTRVQSARRSGG